MRVRGVVYMRCGKQIDVFTFFLLFIRRGLCPEIRQCCLQSMLKIKNERILLMGTPVSQIRDVASYMGTHSVTCHPTQVAGNTAVKCCFKNPFSLTVLKISMMFRDASRMRREGRRIGCQCHHRCASW